MGKEDDKAFFKGQEDFRKSGGHASSNPLKEIISPTYNPPRGHEESYKKGWEREEARKEYNEGGK